MRDPTSEKPSRIALQIALIYAVFGAAWILFSDMILAAWVENPERLTSFQTLKGWTFILVTAVLVYYLVRGYAAAVGNYSTHLRRSERSYRRIVETANEGICTFDVAGRIGLVNARFAEMVGYRPEELAGRPLLDLVDEESRGVIAGKLKDQAPDSAQVCDIRLRDRHQQQIWAIAAISPMFEGGRYIGSLAMLTDISERRRLESQLLQFQKMEAMGQLAGGIAHDFNNIVTAILGNVDLMRLRLKRRPVPEQELAADVDQVERAGERAMALTRQLLTFSRRQIIREELINPRHLLADMEKMLSRLIREDIQLEIKSDENVPFMRADAGQLEQVIVNLVVNARDAMPRGGKVLIQVSRIELDAVYAAGHAEARPGPHVLISVSDTGQGMDEQTRRRALEPFFTTKPAGRGTGLGLATVYAIVKRFGGHVELYSEPGAGTTFKVYLPAAEGTSTTEPAARKVEAAQGGDETILVCEDDPAIRDLMCRILGAKGYRLMSANTPTAAIELAARHPEPIHLLITDVIMAGMNGTELARRLQAQRPEIRVLYVSGHTAEVIRQQGIPEDEVEFLPKPFNCGVLVRRVRQVLDRQETRRNAK